MDLCVALEHFFDRAIESAKRAFEPAESHGDIGAGRKTRLHAFADGEILVLGRAGDLVVASPMGDVFVVRVGIDGRGHGCETDFRFAWR